MPVVVEGLAELRLAIRRAQVDNPRALTVALKAAGAPIVAAAASHAPHRSGLLAGSYSTSVRGARADVISRAPYAGGAEWGRFGKWSGFTRYGATGSRFAGRAIDEKADEVTELVYHGINSVVTAYGWFH